MAGAVDVETRGAIEASERGGGQPQADLAGTQSMEGGRCSGRGMGHATFHQAKAVGEGRLPYSLESCGAGICGGSAVGRRATV